ncbi:hypothetical protein HMPREF9148_01386 [Prevotella sp. F0091]|nr:hypothetical protein HMPREF9148_01386 [Prevotella sp. F0091]
MWINLILLTIYAFNGKIIKKTGLQKKFSLYSSYYKLYFTLLKER